MATPSTDEVLKVVQRGIAGHLTFVAAVEGWGTNSELSLYPPIGSVLTARDWDARCQWRFPRASGDRGASRSIDFVACRKSIPPLEWKIAIEVKLLERGAREHQVQVRNDIEKLREFKSLYKAASTYLLIVGRKADINSRHIYIDEKKIDLSSKSPIIADVGRTAWGSVVVKI